MPKNRNNEELEKVMESLELRMLELDDPGSAEHQEIRRELMLLDRVPENETPGPANAD